MKANSVDIKDLHVDLRRHIVKFLGEGVELPDKLGPLDCDVPPHGIVTLQDISEVLYLLNPW